MPVHGEYRHLEAAAEIAMDLGMNRKNIFIMENGDCLELSKRSAKMTKESVAAGAVMVDGLGVGDVGNIVLRDRRMLSESGLIIVVAAIDKISGEVVSGPDIISRGFVYVRENEGLIYEATEVARHSLEQTTKRTKRGNDWNAMKTGVKDELRKFIYEKTKRNPVILPIFMEV